jgi:hypothetical protein
MKIDNECLYPVEARNEMSRLTDARIVLEAYCSSSDTTICGALHINYNYFNRVKTGKN